MRTMLLDSASLYFRAFYGVPDTLKGPNGLPNNAIRGFCDMIARLVDTYQPDGLVACLDYDWRPQFRVDAIPSYKTHRVADTGSPEEDVPDELSPQVPVIIEVLEASGLCAVGADGFEADDVIGTLATTLPGEVDVVTGDRDLFQVVDDARVVRVLYTARGLGNMALVDNAWLIDKYGVSARQYADFAALRGDASDGLPGVKGIGEKSAAVLLAHYGDLDALRAAAADPTDPGPLKPAQRRNIIAAADYLDAAPRVVQVRRDIPLAVDPALPSTPVDAERLGVLAAQWGFESSLRRMQNAIATRTSA